MKSWILYGGVLAVFLALLNLVAPLFADTDRRRSRWVSVWLLIVAVPVGVLGVMPESRQSTRPALAAAKVEHNPVGAWTVCQQFVERNLIAPATAKYPRRHTDEFVTHQGGGRYRVANYVDSQNRFGTMVRSEFVCTVSHIKGDDWQLDALTWAKQ